MKNDIPTNDPQQQPNWLTIVVKLVLYAVGLIAAAYGVQAAAAMLR